MTKIRSDILYITFLITMFIGSCSHGKFNFSNEGGTTPKDAHEEKQYKRLLYKCYKMGGSRIVKIQNELRCY